MGKRDKAVTLLASAQHRSRPYAASASVSVSPANDSLLRFSATHQSHLFKIRGRIVAYHCYQLPSYFCNIFSCSIMIFFTQQTLFNAISSLLTPSHLDSPVRASKEVHSHGHANRQASDLKCSWAHVDRHQVLQRADQACTTTDQDCVPQASSL